MSGTIPNPIKIYHIVHIDKLSSIFHDGFLLCDAEMHRRQPIGTTIGYDMIKNRRLFENTFPFYPDLHVGDCVPFHFCYRSVMLYPIYKRNPELSYQGGQEPIIHLVADMQQTINWARHENLRWAFTRNNAGANYYDSYNNLSQLNEINWNAVNAREWKACKEGKQAEFLVESHFSWNLVEAIGVYSEQYYNRVVSILSGATHIPQIAIHRDWYY